jgi:hypothetical protein
MTGLQYLVYMEPSKSAVSDGLPPGEDRRVVADGVNTHPRRAGAAGRVRQEDGKCSEWPEKLGYPRVGVSSQGKVDHAGWGGIHGLAVRASRMASMGRRP